MPPKKSKVVKKPAPRILEEDDNIDVHYNPDIVTGLISELEQSVEVKCSQIQKDSDFHCASIQEAFNMELIKIPSQVKQMSIKRFKEEFGFNLEAVRRSAMSGTSVAKIKPLQRSEMSVGGNNVMSQYVCKTPSHNKYHNNQLPRNPREGELILSQNGSPLGEFSTVVKAIKEAENLNIQPSGVFVPLKTGQVIDIENVDLECLSAEDKEETLAKMQEVMQNMQSLMAKLNQSRV